MGRDGWIGAGLLLFSGWLYSNLKYIPENPLVPLGPSFYPRLLLILIFLLSLSLVLQDLLSAGGTRKERMSFKNWLQKYHGTLISFSLFGIYVLLLPHAGYLLSTLLFVSALQWLLGQPMLRRVPVSLTIGVVTSALTYLVFEKYLHVLLPRGTWLP